MLIHLHPLKVMLYDVEECMWRTANVTSPSVQLVDDCSQQISQHVAIRVAKKNGLFLLCLGGIVHEGAEVAFPVGHPNHMAYFDIRYEHGDLSNRHQRTIFSFSV